MISHSMGGKSGDLESLKEDLEMKASSLLASEKGLRGNRRAEDKTEKGGPMRLRLEGGD